MITPEYEEQTVIK